jgi:hypothetical protein
MRRWLCVGLFVVMLCQAALVEADGKPPQEYDTLVSTTGDFPAITWLEYWNAAFVGYGATYDEAFTMANAAAARGGWETANILPKPPNPPITGPFYLVLVIHTAPPGGDPPPIIGRFDDA